MSRFFLNPSPGCPPPTVTKLTVGERMGKEHAGKKRKRRLRRLPDGAEARFLRRAAILIGLVPLAAMTQHEVDWLFRQRVRLAE